MSSVTNENTTTISFSFRSLLITIVITTIIAMIPISIVVYELNDSNTEIGNLLLAVVVFPTIIGIVFGSSLYLLYYLFVRTNYAIRVAANNLVTLRKSSQDLQLDLSEDFFTTLVRINFKYIDLYYEQTKLQADKSFSITVVAALSSFVLILIGIALSFLHMQTSVSPAAVATGAGVLGQFISAVFFYLYNQTIIKMADYHRKLVFTQNVSLSLKISEELPLEEKTKAQLALIQALTNNVNEYLSK